MKPTNINTLELGGGGLNNSNTFNQIQKEHFFNVDFLRFIFIFVIFLHHLFNPNFLGFDKNSFSSFINNTRLGSLCIFFYFIVSGFFLTYTFDKNLSVIDFIKKKIIRFWPLVAFGIFVFCILGIFGISKFSFYNNIFSLFLLSNVGITFSLSNNGPDWFVSSLFFISTLYFYIFKYFKKTTYDFFIAIFVIFSFIFLLHATKGELYGHIKTTAFVFNHGLLRAFGGIGLGYFIHEFYLYLKSLNYKQTPLSFFIYTGFEIYILSFLIYETMLHKMHFNNKMIIIIGFVLLFLLFLLKRGFLSKILNHKFSTFLGKYTFAIFLTHYAVLECFTQLWFKKDISFALTHPLLIIVITFLTSLIFAIITYHFVEVPAGKFLKKKFFPQKA